MGRNSTEAGKLVTQLIARICNNELGTNGSVTAMDKVFERGDDERGRFVPDGRSSDHFHGRVQMLEMVFRQYFDMLRKNCGQTLISCVRLFRVLVSIEKREDALKQWKSIGARDQKITKCLNQDLTQHTSAQRAVLSNLEDILSLPNFRFFTCTIALQRIHLETLPQPQHKATTLLTSSFTYACMTTALALVKEDLHKFMVKHLFSPITPTSSMSILNHIGVDGFWDHMQFVERLYVSFQKFVDDKPSPVKKEFVFRLSFADLDELMHDIEWRMNTIDSYDHQTRFGLSFVFDDMGLSFVPPYKRVTSVL